MLQVQKSDMIRGGRASTKSNVAVIADLTIEQALASLSVTNAAFEQYTTAVHYRW